MSLSIEALPASHSVCGHCDKPVLFTPPLAHLLRVQRTAASMFDDDDNGRDFAASTFDDDDGRNFAYECPLFVTGTRCAFTLRPIKAILLILWTPLHAHFYSPGTTTSKVFEIKTSLTRILPVTCRSTSSFGAKCEQVHVTFLSNKT
jgi:hypothetical protein